MVWAPRVLLELEELVRELDAVRRQLVEELRLDARREQRAEQAVARVRGLLGVLDRLREKMSCIVTTSDSIRSTSVMCVMRREPSTRRETWTIRSNAADDCSRMARSGRSTPAVSTSVSTRLMASRGVFAWIVVSEPSWPVFMAWSMSTVSGAAALADDDAVGPHPQGVPDEVADRDLALALDVGGPRLERDHVLLRELQLGRVLDRDDALAVRDEADSTFSVVVLPEPVPPEIRMFSLPRTQARGTRPAFGVSVPNAIRSSHREGVARNFRIVSVGPLTASGGMIALTRRAVGQARVDHRRGLVDAAADRG